MVDVLIEIIDEVVGAFLEIMTELVTNRLLPFINGRKSGREGNAGRSGRAGSSGGSKSAGQADRQHKAKKAGRTGEADTVKKSWTGKRYIRLK